MQFTTFNLSMYMLTLRSLVNKLKQENYSRENSSKSEVTETIFLQILVFFARQVLRES